MKEPIIKRKHKSKNIFKEEVRKIPAKDRPNIKLSQSKVMDQMVNLRLDRLTI